MSLLPTFLHGLSTHTTLGMSIYATEVYIIVIAAFFSVMLLIGIHAARDEWQDESQEASQDEWRNELQDE